jgi:FKBP-type peptidyl-prolyl cis-trans isomerase 2
MRDPERIGKLAHIRYIGGVKGEEALDDRSTGEPLSIIIGDGKVPRGIENLLYELEVGESRVIEIPCELGYGEHRSEGVQWYLRTMLANGENLRVGSVLTWTNPESHLTLPARVVCVTKDTVQIDQNHPFAGKTLEYWVELVDLT